MKCTNTLFGIHADFLNATTGTTYRSSYLRALKDYNVDYFISTCIFPAIAKTEEPNDVP